MSDWTEIAERRTRTAKHYRNVNDDRRFAVDAVLATVHDNLAEIDMTPLRVNNAAADGWLVSAAEWHYFVGKPKTGAFANVDGVVGFGGRRGANWLRFRLQRVGYLHWASRAWQDIGGAPSYLRTNLTSDTGDLLGVHSETISRWANVWNTPGGGALDVSWRSSGAGMKEEITINQAARSWITANRPPSTAATQTWFSFVFEMDWSDIPRLYRDGVLQSVENDISGDEPIELRDAGDQLLTLLPAGHGWVRGYENAPFALQRRLYKDGAKYYMLIGVRCDVLAALPDGDLVFDPTLDYIVGAGANDAWWDTSAINTGAAGIRLGINGGVYRSSFARWSVTIPAGATIDTAYVTLTDWWNESTSASVATTIAGHDADNPAALTTQAGCVSATRTTATASFVWASGTAQTTGVEHTTPELKTIIQELVNSYDYSSGAALTLLFDYASSSADRQIIFNAYDDSTTTAPKLHIEYSTIVSVSKSDAATVGEAISLAPQTQIAKSDAVAVAESASLTRSVAAIAVADAATVGESASVTRSVAAIAVADAVAVAESASLVRSVAAVAKSDAATVGEAISLAPQTQIAKSDAVTVAESTSVVRSVAAVVVADAATVAESASVTRSVAASAVADAVTVAEAISVEVGAQAVINVTASDATSVGESIGVEISAPAIAVGDAASVGESVSLQVVRTITQMIFASSDDGHWSTEGTSFNATGSVFSIGKEYDAFMRWQITLPANSTIRRAYITLTDPYTVGGTSVDINLAISAHDAAAPAAPTTYTDAESATRTTASVAWSIPTGSTQTLHTPRTTPDLSAIIQELANSYDYSSGSAIVLFVDYAAMVSYQSQIFYAYDGSATYAPAIYIGYTTTTQFVGASDAATVSEAISLVRSVAEVVGADAVTVGEAISLTRSVAEVVGADAVTVGEAISLTRSVAEVVGADAATLAESVTLQPLTQISVADAATVADSATAAVSYPQIVVADAVTLDESAQIIRELVDVRQLSTSSAVAVAESLAVTVTDPQISTADASTVAESATVAFDHQVTASDASTVADSHAVTVSTALVAASDASTVADSAIVAFDHHVAASDAVGVSESITVTVSVLQIAVSDGVTVVDVVVAAVSVLQITVSDGVAVVESYTLHAVLFIAVTDAASVAESLTLPPPLLSLTASDAISVADIFTGYPAQLLLQTADAITVGDTIAMFVIVLHGLVDVTLADSAAYRAILADSALYRATLADSALYNATVSDRTRTEGIG